MLEEGRQRREQLLSKGFISRGRTKRRHRFWDFHKATICNDRESDSRKDLKCYHGNGDGIRKSETFDSFAGWVMEPTVSVNLG